MQSSDPSFLWLQTTVTALSRSDGKVWVKTKKLGISNESSEGRLVREGHKGAEHEGSRFNVYAMYAYEFPRLFSSLFAGGVWRLILSCASGDIMGYNVIWGTPSHGDKMGWRGRQERQKREMDVLGRGNTTKEWRGVPSPEMMRNRL